MKKTIKKIILLSVCLLMLVLLCSCDSGVINTEMTLNKDFAGTRVMTFDIKQSDLNGADFTGVFSNLIGTPKAADIVKVLEDSCPDELIMKTSKNGDDVTCIFTLVFSDKANYEKKIAALLGSNPVVRYSQPNSDDLFTSGVTLSENFSSADLFGWAQDALKDAYPKFADKMSFSKKSGTTAVIFDGVRFATGDKINLSPKFTPLSLVKVNTTRYGDNDYVCDVAISISPENAESIGKTKLESTLFAPLTNPIRDISTCGWNEDGSAYVISMKQGNLAQLGTFMEAVFHGSTIEYDSNSDSDAFSESGKLSEHIDFSGFVCNEDGSTNAALVYTAGDDTTFKDGGTEGGKLADGGKTYTVECKGVTEQDVSVISETRYTVESVSVLTELDLTGKYTVSVSCSFPAESSRSAAERAAEKLSETYKDSDLDFDAVATAYESNDNGASVEGYMLVISADGTPEKITKAFSEVFGESNSFAVKERGKLDLNRKVDVTHNIDLTVLTDMAKYDGNFTYTFNSTMSKIQEVKWSDAKGGGNNNLLEGNVRKNTFYTSQIGDPQFTVSYQYNVINVKSIVLFLIIGVLVLGLLMTVVNAISKRSRLKRSAKRSILEQEAVRSVALAIIPEDKRSELKELPAELMLRPTKVIEPKNDDGLNEDDDEPEGVQMFATTLRILILAVMALFFFPICNVQHSGASAVLNGVSESITGWKLFYGTKLFGIEVAPYRMAIVLLAVPLIMLVVLMAKKALPKLIAPLFLTAGSLFQIYYLTKLPDEISNMIDAIRTSITGYVTKPSLQMGYNYSIVIYVLLAIGGIILLFADLSGLITTRRRDDDQ